MNLVSLVMIGSNPHLAPPGSDVGLLSRFESGVQRVHLLSLLLLILPLPVPRREVQVFNKSVGKTGVREVCEKIFEFQIHLSAHIHIPEPPGVDIRLAPRVHPLLRPDLAPSAVVPLQGLSVPHPLANALRPFRLDSPLLLLDLLPGVLLVLVVLLDLGGRVHASLNDTSATCLVGITTKSAQIRRVRC